MKKTLLIISCLLLSITSAFPDTWDGTSSIWNIGSGTKVDPYLIENAQQFAYLSSSVSSATGTNVYSGKYFKLTTDIDLDNKAWTPIGTSTKVFYGNFDGNNHTISNLSASSLFGIISNDTIANLTVGGLYTGTGSIVGIISTATNSYIKNCINQRSLSQTVSNATTSYYCSGICAKATTCIIDNCINNGTINSSIPSSTSFTTYTSGICAYADGTIITKSINTAPISGSQTTNSTLYLGGLIGKAKTGAAVSLSYNLGLLSCTAATNCNSYLGGITGYMESGLISNSYNKGDMSLNSSNSTAVGYLGGVAGSLKGSLKNCYNSGKLTSNYCTKGGVYGTVPETPLDTNAIHNDSTVQAYATYKSDELMKSMSLVEIFNHFSKSKIWHQDKQPYINNGYPILYYQSNDTTLNIIPADTTKTDIWDGYAMKWTKGSGSASDPFLIESSKQLAYLSEMILANITSYSGVYFKQSSDLNLNNIPFSAIGSTSTLKFSGNYDGGSHSISNFNGYALFGSISSACISNLNVSGVYNGKNVGQYCGGIIAKATSSTISNCCNKRTITILSGAYYVGGVVGYANQCVTSKCSNLSALSVLANSTSIYIGGIIGYANLGSVSESYNKAILSCTNTNGLVAVGGIIGYSLGSTISKSFNAADLSSINSNSLIYVGGIGGTGCSISDCYNTGEITSTTPTTNTNGGYTGGISGFSGPIFNSYNIGKISGTVCKSNYFGSLYGKIDMGTLITNSYYKDKDSTQVAAIEKSAYEMKDPTFVSTLNNSVNTIWKQDFDSLVNNGFPILDYQLRLIKVSFVNKSISLNVGQDSTLTLNIYPTEAYNKNIKWASSDTSIAKVTTTGKVSAIKIGTAFIYATSEDKNRTDTCFVTVSSPATSILNSKHSKDYIYSVNKTIIINTDTTDNIYIHNISGELIAKNQKAVIVDFPGVYLVSIENKTYKILIK